MAEWDDYELFWKETLKLIKSEKGDQEFAMWFNLEFLKATEKEIIIAVPSSFYRDQVKERYQNYLESTLKGLTGKDIFIVFEVKQREVENTATNMPGENKEKRPKEAVSNETPPVNAPVKEKKSGHAQLNKDYTFDRYVIGENNNFASASAQAIARNPGTAYNPFFIYGGVGLGKTHLMQAIGNYVHENSTKKIIYVTAENFMNEFIIYVQENRMSVFKNKYRFVDILLIDDIHFLEKKWETQEELFHTFNALYEAKKQIVFTCDRPASELKNINDRLRSRFERGLNVDLQPPNFETRCAILKKKVENTHIIISDDVIALIGKNVSTNVRDLEAALTKLIAYSDLVGKPITLEAAQQQLKDVFASPRQTNMSIDVIQRVVADHFSLLSSDIKGKKRSQTIVFPRHLAMFIAREITEFSTTEVGQSFGGRDHATVMHACQKIEERKRADPTLDSTIQNLIRMIKDTSAKS
jgi:chromosomal replication initiator protein